MQEHLVHRHHQESVQQPGGRELQYRDQREYCTRPHYPSHRQSPLSQRKVLQARGRIERRDVYQGGQHQPKVRVLLHLLQALLREQRAYQLIQYLKN